MTVEDCKKYFFGEHALAYRPVKKTVRVMDANAYRPKGTTREIVYLDRVEVVLWR